MKFSFVFSKYILSFDLIVSIILTLSVFILFYISADVHLLLLIIEKLTDAGVTVFSVMFPLFFAAFSIIITSSDDDFSKFLQKNGYYQEIINTFKFTLLLVFIAFVYSILLYSTIKVLFVILSTSYFYVITCSYIFILFYSLFAAFNSILDSIRYAQRRGTYYFNKSK